nr:MAG TPA_asm: hypothetical protein [Bacteriophage sp.]
MTPLSPKPSIAAMRTSLYASSVIASNRITTASITITPFAC